MYTSGGAYVYMAERNREYLEIGKVYTVEETEVYASFTNAELQEFPGITFSSANFEDVASQPEQDTQRHADWPRWRS